MQVYVWKNGSRRTVEVEAALAVRSVAEACSTGDEMRVPASAEAAGSERTRIAGVACQDSRQRSGSIGSKCVPKALS